MLFRKAIFIIHGFAGGVWDHQNLANELQMYLDFDVYMITSYLHYYYYYYCFYFLLYYSKSEL